MLVLDSDFPLEIAGAEITVGRFANTAIDFGCEEEWPSWSTGKGQAGGGGGQADRTITGGVHSRARS